MNTNTHTSGRGVRRKHGEETDIDNFREVLEYHGRVHKHSKS